MMKNKLLKTFTALVISVTFSMGVNYSYVNASWEIENDTLTIHNEGAGKLLQGYKEGCIFHNIENIVVTGKMDKMDFMSLKLVAYDSKSINLYDVETDSIPVGIFRQNLRLERFILPRNLKAIGALAFADCDNLEIEELPESLEFIGNYAFEYCGKLNITVPSKVKLGEGVFNHCPNVHFLKDDEINAPKEYISSKENSPSKAALSSIISYVCSWFY